MQNNFPKEEDDEEGAFLTDFELIERVISLPLDEREKITVKNLINATKSDEAGTNRLQPSQRRWFLKQLAYFTE